MAANSIQLNSYAAKGLNMEQALRVVEGDRLVTRAGKFTAGTALTMGTAAFAALETIFSAAATIATFTVSYFAPERYAAIKTHTADSAKTVVLAAKRTFGAEIASAASKAAKVDPSRVEQLKTLAKDKMATALLLGQKHRTALIASTISVIVLSAYYGGLFDYAYSLIKVAEPLVKQPLVKRVVNPFPQSTEIASMRFAECFKNTKGNISFCNSHVDLTAAPKAVAKGSVDVAKIWHSRLPTAVKQATLRPYVAPESLAKLSAVALPKTVTQASNMNNFEGTMALTCLVAGAAFKGIAAATATALGSPYVAPYILALPV